MENPIKMGDLGVPLFFETPICYHSDLALFLSWNSKLLWTENSLLAVGGFGL